MYHSEKGIIHIALKANKNTGLKIAGITAQQVEDGALLIATNEERKLFFRYSSMIAAVATAILVPISSLFLVLYLSTIGPNLGSALCMPFWITVFISQSLGEKARQCDFYERPVVFSSKDLLYSFLKAAILVLLLVGWILWTIS